MCDIKQSNQINDRAVDSYILALYHVADRARALANFLTSRGGSVISYKESKGSQVSAVVELLFE